MARLFDGNSEPNIYINNSRCTYESFGTFPVEAHLNKLEAVIHKLETTINEDCGNKELYKTWRLAPETIREIGTLFYNEVKNILLVSDGERWLEVENNRLKKTFKYSGFRNADKVEECVAHEFDGDYIIFKTTYGTEIIGWREPYKNRVKVYGNRINIFETKSLVLLPPQLPSTRTEKEYIYEKEQTQDIIIKKNVIQRLIDFVFPKCSYCNRRYVRYLFKKYDDKYICKQCCWIYDINSSEAFRVKDKIREEVVMSLKREEENNVRKNNITNL